MNISEDKIARLCEILGGGPRRVVIVSHTNPDGDAIGSSLAWATVLRRHGHTAECVVPNRYPDFLSWMPDIATLHIFKDSPAKIKEMVREADVIFCLDFNQIQRLDGIGPLIEANTAAERVLIDHHLDPPNEYTLQFSHPESSSTSLLVYKLIERVFSADEVDKAMAEQLYVGIMTDTGNFSFSFLSAELFRTVAMLVEKGIDIPYINRMVYHSFSADRLKLLGFALNKMQTLDAAGNQVAYITLKESDLRRFNFQLGDSEGFVNYPLSIRGLALSAMFIETRHFIRISFRSRPDVDCSAFARKYFNGGGHKNASGGKSFVPMAETIENFKKAATEFFNL